MGVIVFLMFRPAMARDRRPIVDDDPACRIAPVPGNKENIP